jgi:hypothetical protein
LNKDKTLNQLVAAPLKEHAVLCYHIYLFSVLYYILSAINNTANVIGAITK